MKLRALVADVDERTNPGQRLSSRARLAAASPDAAPPCGRAARDRGRSAFLALPVRRGSAARSRRLANRVSIHFIRAPVRKQDRRQDIVLDKRRYGALGWLALRHASRGIPAIWNKSASEIVGNVDRAGASGSPSLHPSTDAPVWAVSKRKSRDPGPGPRTFLCSSSSLLIRAANAPERYAWEWMHGRYALYTHWPKRRLGQVGTDRRWIDYSKVGVLGRPACCRTPIRKAATARCGITVLRLSRSSRGCLSRVCVSAISPKRAAQRLVTPEIT
jgi:hypothetical protein